MPEIRKTICPKDRKEWRDWLKKNHHKENSIFLIHHKRHTGKHFLSHRETLEEAICFGWIDTTVKRLDEDRFGRFFVKRGKNSRWSKATQSYAEQLIKNKKMTAAGLKAYKEGLAKPVIDHGLPRNPDTPADLHKALGSHSEKFSKLAPSYRRYYIWWIERAKRAETREKRIREVVQKVKEGKKPSDSLKN